MNAIIKSLLFLQVMTMANCWWGQKYFHYQDYYSNSTTSDILITCIAYNDTADWEMNITKHGDLFYSHSTFRKVTEFTPISGIDSIEIHQPGEFVIRNINESTAGKYVCSQQSYIYDQKDKDYTFDDSGLTLELNVVNASVDSYRTQSIITMLIIVLLSTLLVN